ncbi:MAG: hypothetical protein P1V81_17510 [Planctomycetota bacterium]|nr:hypothetical protein [Planctomycetota bacterium]
MTDARSRGRAERARPFLTVIARAPSQGGAGPCEHLQELLAAARQLLLFPAPDGWERSGSCAGFRSALDPDAVLTLLSHGPQGTTMGAEPRPWLDAALRSPGCRSDAIGLETTVVVTEDLQVLAPRPGNSQDFELLCDLSRERFVPAWNAYLERAAPAATLSRAAPVLCGVEQSKPESAQGDDLSDADLAARLAELEDQLRELAHERSVLRENRDFAREEHLRELQVHRTLNDENRAKAEAYEQELESRAQRIDELLASLKDFEAHHLAEIHAHREERRTSQAELLAELESRAAKLHGYEDELVVRATIISELQEAVDSLEDILRRTRAVRIAKWLDRLGALRKKLPGGRR